VKGPRGERKPFASLVVRYRILIKTNARGLHIRKKGRTTNQEEDTDFMEKESSVRGQEIAFAKKRKEQTFNAEGGVY